MYATPRVGAGPQAAEHFRTILRGLDPELTARQQACGRHDVAVGRLRGRCCAVGSREDIVRRSVELVRDWLMSGQEPAGEALSELYEAARAAAGHGLSAEDAVRACSGVARTVQSALLQLDSAEDREWLRSQLEVPWAFVDVALTTVTRAFTDQRDLPFADDNSRAATLLARVCARSATTIEDLDRAERLGFDLVGPYSPFVAAIDDGSAAAHASMAARLRAAGALACAEGHRVAGLTKLGFDWKGFLADSTLVLATQPATGRAGLGEAIGTLHDLVTLAGRAGRRGRIQTEDFLTEIMLANSPQLADSVMQRVLGRLQDSDPSGTLTQTLTCLAAHGFDRTATAAALPAHRNTLLYRINRIEKLCGLDLDRHAHRELARLAVVWTQTVAPEGAVRSG